MKDKFEMLSDNVIYTGTVFDIREQRINLPEANMTVNRQVMDTSDSVSIAVVNKEGKILITKEFRSAVEQFTWSIPAGRLEPNEDPKVSARRELAEETGLLVDQKAFKRVAVVSLSAGVMNEYAHVFIVQLTDNNYKIVDQSFDEDEYIAKMKWVSLKSAYRLAQTATSHIALTHIELERERHK